MLLAQKEGNFTASPARAKVGVPDGSRRDIFGMSFGTKWYQTASNSLDIEVLPQSQDADLIGNFTVDTTIDTQEVKTNKPVNVTLKIVGKGNLESFEFPKYEIDGVTVYSDDANIETSVVDGQLHSTYVKSFAFISDRDFTIPERTFTMLDPQSDTLKTLRVNGYEVKVTSSATSAPAVNSTPSQGMVQTNIPEAVEPKEIIVEKQVEVKSVAWWMLAVAFVLGGVFMYLTTFYT